MAATTIKLPAYITLENKSKEVVKFAPYKENFNTALGAGVKLVLTATTAGQVLYYLMQATNALAVTQAEAKPSGADIDACATEASPAEVKIENKTKVPMNFVPYRENFQFALPAGDSYTFSATTAGQVIYYMNQEVEGALEVTITPKSGD